MKTPPEETVANLLAALKACRDTLFSDLLCHSSVSTSVAYNLANAAIDKAEGRT